MIYLTVGQGVTSDPGGINESCERAATVKGPKLGAADADETDLFVWVEGSRPGLEIAMFRNDPPVEGPALTREVDVVWVGCVGATDDGRFGLIRLWRARRDEASERVDASQLARWLPSHPVSARRSKR